MKAIIGLGNPGKAYEKTRHNVGFMVLDTLITSASWSSFPDWSLSKKYNALVSEGTKEGEKILCAKPMTFMNASGQSVQLIAHFYHLSLDDILVVHDDKDLLLGEVKMQKDRGDAGHNGVRSIMDLLGTKNFTRVRVGVHPADNKKMTDTAAFVLRKFAFSERTIVKNAIQKSITHIETFLQARS
ncbi:MAG TPA: aminoacyl-tRNA hydrolase [Candidatus Magasanikbacteria bacterium]|nr:MAG: aminoacyl-tRNA hydrolase [Candidatus Magasanikbacteria bacterium RIFCSPLOWO2_02_FULL_47_16]OGH80233.1 MAG: aminoacyl-tRNA hydrolase [Candidatus Magasanikbacteria bacterium RIFCSPHIGHO2_02_FULL_48_18]OGH82131.1 MAG: aminoacyl-tRNA hydrolase [Candidatus Magasanikbacteria bacterium RIFCSPLOWO2_12_FULL_47_9b]HAZ29061.1 aminoacyl-tRNA hydrolase [Candidatus Magasanikbacteria bacterium]